MHGLLGPNSILVVYMDPLGLLKVRRGSPRAFYDIGAVRVRIRSRDTFVSENRGPYSVISSLMLPEAPFP